MDEGEKARPGDDLQPHVLGPVSTTGVTPGSSFVLDAGKIHILAGGLAKHLRERT